MFAQFAEIVTQKATEVREIAHFFVVCVRIGNP